MILYYAPGACSLAIHVLMEEIGKPYEARRVDLLKGEQFGPEYKSMNPKSKVPVLERDDGSYLTELPAIAWYLCRTNPDADLIPPGIEGETRMLELLDYMVATLHMRGFARVVRPEVFSPSPGDKEKVQQTGRDIMTQGFQILSVALAGKDYVFGKFSAADPVLFLLEFWAVSRGGMTLPAELEPHYRRMLSRPAVTRVLADEGLSAS